MKKLYQELLNSIVLEIKLNPKVTESYLENKYLVSERTIRRYIKILKDQGVIERIGKGKTRKWIVKEVF